MTVPGKPLSQQALADLVCAALPQTQCTRCGFPDCKAYANAIVQDGAAINQCSPGGAEGITRLSHITGQPVLPLNPDNGIEGPRSVAFVDENWCIGCTLCIEACPTDAIIGSNKMMHTVIEPHCTGCELCIPVCPVDCIELENVSGTLTGWAAWSDDLASHALNRYTNHHKNRHTNSYALNSKQLNKNAGYSSNLSKNNVPSTVTTDKTAVIAAALAIAREKARVKRS